ncbi:hypothetical protein DPMN_158972 [Dreissena polymorpha]|uniref:B box-type domain-containing protein n=1 Tax=Dreissena polymorpha TaxID=45954 RepID=A0A9D4IQB2_DREPO|nr:hypothetical protein DPMN_158972 [Dreissena polymorpha]
MSTIIDSDIHLQKCPHHETENQTFYCVNHDVTICGRCLYSNHKLCIDSSIDLFTVSVDEARHRETVEILIAFEEQIEGYKKKLSEDIALNEQYKLNTMAAIDSFSSKMINRLTDLKKHAEIECTQKHKHNSERLSQLVKKCNEEKCMITQRKHLVEVLVQKQHSRQLYIEIGRLDRNKHDIATRTNDLMKDKVKVKFSFRPNDKLENVIFHEINDVGNIQETTNDSDEVQEAKVKV